MKQPARAVVVAGLAVVALVLVFPPFMVIDLAAPDTRHGALGHYPFWRPPTPATAGRVLTERFGPSVEGAPSSLRVGVNRVRLALEVMATAVVVLGWSAVLHWRRRSHR